MDVRVTGHQVDVGDSLQTQAVSRIEGLAEKYFPRAVAANVTFSPGPYADFVCDIVAPVINNVVLKAHQRAPEAHIAFEGAADKIEKQLSKYAKRLREHKADGTSQFVEDAGYTVFAPQPEAPVEKDEGGASDDRCRDEGRHPGSQRLRCSHAARSSQHECADVQK